MINSTKNQDKVWDKIIAPKAFDFNGNDAFSSQDCLNSAITSLQHNLAEKINFGIVLIWDKNQEMFTNFYSWHCWAVTKNGQPFDCSVHHWHNIFSELNPPIIPEKDPLKMSCQLINEWGNKNAFKRDQFSADAIYLNGGLTSENLHLIPKQLKTIIYLSGLNNGLNLEQTLNLLNLN